MLYCKVLKLMILRMYKPVQFTMNKFISKMSYQNLWCIFDTKFYSYIVLHFHTPDINKLKWGAIYKINVNIVKHI